MKISLAWMLATSVASQPEDVRSIAETEILARLVEDGAIRERRSRLLSGSTDLGVGLAGIGIGIYFLAGTYKDEPGVRNAAVVQLASGSGLAIRGLLSVTRRDYLQKIYEGSTYRRLRGNNVTCEDQDAFESLLLFTARRARAERRLLASLTLVGGIARTTVGSFFLFSPGTTRRSEGEVILGAFNLTAGLGLFARGIYTMLARSPTETVFRSYRHVVYTNPRLSSLRMVPTGQGMALTGRF